MSIALFDCHVSAEKSAALDELWRSGCLAAGPAVGELETRIGTYLGGHPAVALSDMTQALALALRLAGVGRGDDVATLALNCMSSNCAVGLVGARAIWIDVDPTTATIDLEDLAAAITSRTKAVVVYHVAGYVADLKELRAFCNSRELPLIEDANAALGARWTDLPVGSFGDYAVYSFYANRQVNGIEGAALVCPDEESADRARRLRRFGIDTARFRKSDGEIDPALDVPEIGIPASLPNVNAALACMAMNDLDERIARNRAHAEILSRELTDLSKFSFVKEHPDAKGAFWVALARSERRDEVVEALKARGVQCSKLHFRNDRYSGFSAERRRLPGTTVLEQEMFALPCGWWLSREDVGAIAESVRSALA